MAKRSTVITQPPVIIDTSLREEAQRRYLNYALSVITSRALPDVRDGLKPVQRRILYTMFNELGLRHDGRFVKCARVVGDVMGKFHPHGDTSIYDALVRLAQDFSMRLPLVAGRGNFGSDDGDGAAAMRYTEAKLSKAAHELLSELDKATVDFRPNYDGEYREPTVLPARFPNLLVNGTQGIAVGMATSIPPHNLSEVIDAALCLIDEPDTTVKGLMKFIKGPDFPTGGHLVSSKRELEEAYETGSGSLKVRGTWTVEDSGKTNPQIIITSIPYNVERCTIVERIAELIIDKKVPMLLDVRDESAETTRVVCEIRKGTDPQLVMAYLFKHTPLSMTVSVNLTCLVPNGLDPEGMVHLEPRRVDLKTALRCFLDFRMDVVVRRIQFELAELKKRIHILEGFVLIFDALDEVLRIIRRSEGRADASKKLIARFSLSEIQVNAILELRLYRLARLEIQIIHDELEAKRKSAKQFEQLLASAPARWKLIKAELGEVKNEYPSKRTTKIIAAVDEPSFVAEDFIVNEDAYVILSQGGWVKRQREVKDIGVTRLREGDSVLDVAAGSTKSSLAFFSSHGSCYVMRLNDVPATSGHGVPVQSLFKLADGERILRMMCFDSRLLDVPPPTEGSAEPEAPLALAVTKGGLVCQFSLRQHREQSTRTGRRFMKLNDGDEIVYVDHTIDRERVACVTEKGNALVCLIEEVPVLLGAGKGVRLIRLDEGDAVLGAQIMTDATQPLMVENEAGKTFEVTVWKAVVSRGGKGTSLWKRGRGKRTVPPPPSIPQLGGQ